MSNEKCNTCNGKGYIECPMEYSDDKHPSSCAACGGTEKAVCPDCRGTGKEKQ